MRRVRFATWALVGMTAAMLCGCTAKPGAASGGPGQERADEAAVRRLLADAEQRINQGDLSFVDAFAKDAVIIAPSIPDIVDFDAIRSMYGGICESKAP
jgi:hypothetical protein